MSTNINEESDSTEERKALSWNQRLKDLVLEFVRKRTHNKKPFSIEDAEALLVEIENRIGIYELRGAMGLRRENSRMYRGAYSTGRFDQLYDYGAGILEVRIHCTPNYNGTGDKNNDGWSISFSISTVDDGGWAARSTPTEHYTEQEAINKIEEIAKSFEQFLDNSCKLPTEEALNEFLMPFGLWGQYEG